MNRISKIRSTVLLQRFLIAHVLFGVSVLFNIIGDKPLYKILISSISFLIIFLWPALSSKKFLVNMIVSGNNGMVEIIYLNGWLQKRILILNQDSMSEMTIKPADLFIRDYNELHVNYERTRQVFRIVKREFLDELQAQFPGLSPKKKVIT